MSSYEYNKKYAAVYLEKFERIDLKVPKGKRQLIRDHAAKNGESVNAYINRVIDADMKKEGE